MKKLIQFSITILLLSGLISCQDKMQDDRLLSSDKAGNSEALLLQCNFVTLPSTINSNMTLSAANTYLIDGVVQVTNNATLTIPAGTVLQGVKGNNSFLVINRGASIVANGTSTNPIVFTSDQATGSRAPGDWGGIVLLGQAPNNQSNVLGITIASSAYTGGGTSATSSSGSLQFVQIHYAGAGGGTGDRLSESALILNSVGTGTTIDRVQISQSERDGIGVWGGTVDITRVFNHAVQRTDFMVSYGYQGNGQYLAGFKHDATANTTDVFAFGMDISNVLPGDSPTGGPSTYPTFSNATFLGGDFCNGDDSFNDAIIYRQNGNGRIYNSVISSFSQLALEIDGDASIANTASFTDPLEFSYNSFHSIPSPQYDDNPSATWSAAGGCGIDMTDWIEGTAGLGCEEVNNQFSVTTLGLDDGEICIACPGFPDFTLGTNSLLSPNYGWDTGSEFDQPSFRGAFGSTPWVSSGWMDFCPQNTDYCI